MARVAVLGLGAMGSRVAASLIDAGHALTVWNRTREMAAPLAGRGADVAPSPREAAERSDYVIAFVRDDEASRFVWSDTEAGALDAMKAGAVAIESSTLSIRWVADLAGRFADKGIPFIDAPVVGSRRQAEAKQLIFLAGGDSAVIERCAPLFSAASAAVHHAGASGAGAVAKLAVNALFGVQVAAIAELCELVRHAGASPERVLDIIAATPVCSPAAKAAATAMQAGDFAPSFPTELVEKDFGYAVAAAGCDEKAPLVAAARRVFARAIERGCGADDLTGIVRLYQPA
jgi:3-hydroxyisobutyrate dehydrogenase-like beta-hydroxyacid dehydrogenase